MMGLPNVRPPSADATTSMATRSCVPQPGLARVSSKSVYETYMRAGFDGSMALQFLSRKWPRGWNREARTLATAEAGSPQVLPPSVDLETAIEAKPGKSPKVKIWV